MPPASGTSHTAASDADDSQRRGGGKFRIHYTDYETNRLAGLVRETEHDNAYNYVAKLDVDPEADQAAGLNDEEQHRVILDRAVEQRLLDLNEVLTLIQRYFAMRRFESPSNVHLIRYSNS